VVNSAPITDDKGNSRGALASFDDMTELERRNTQLEEALDTLEKSRDEVRQQNCKLQLLATHDALTECLNRRAFLERLEASLASSKRYGHAVSCIMVDIDHFKAVSDNHGHGVGDQVLQRVAEALQSVLRKNDSLCRFGGEEFCIILPYANTQSGILTASRLRHAVELQVCAGVHVTVSLGVASTESGVDNPTELLDWADKALYLAKNTGRNRVASAEEVSARACAVTDQDTSTTEAVDATSIPEETIPLEAVSALMSAMEQRDPETAEHCRHTAELCVALAEDLMPPSECFCVEVAGLLHDIGKIGVPDTILRKPAQLTETERKIMHEHDRMGAEIIASAFPSPTLAKIVRSHHIWYKSNTPDPTMPVGKDIPLGARILAIADAFSAMVSNRPYRRRQKHEDAFAELRCFAGRQFDPDLVERFIEIARVRAKSENQSSGYLSQTVKLGIGREAQRLATAVGLGDFPEIALIAGRLAVDANKEGLGSIAKVATDIEKEASTNCDQHKIVSLATDLMASCGLDLAELAIAG
jgi:diguanylate cyclase (GGDEF)-like protein/putative nucleotidyltransferase with HDIG domain